MPSERCRLPQMFAGKRKGGLEGVRPGKGNKLRSAYRLGDSPNWTDSVMLRPGRIETASAPETGVTT